MSTNAKPHFVPPTEVTADANSPIKLVSVIGGPKEDIRR
jgi:hypothetical protein